MRKRLGVVFGLVVIVITMIGVALVAVTEDVEFAPVDLTRTILLPDGSERTLETIVALTIEALEAEPTPASAETVDKDTSSMVDDEIVLSDDLPLGHIFVFSEIPSRRVRRTESGWTFEANPHDALGLASIKMDELRDGQGSADEVFALLRSVPESHPGYAEAQRHIGWSMLTRHQDEPAKGVPFVTRALVAAPFDGDSWQDATRVYASALGFSLHDF